MSRACLLLLVAVLFFNDDDQQPVLPKDTLPAKLDIETIPAGLSKKRNIDASNPLTDARVQLGRKLFFDAILSKDGTVSCASCHQPDHGFASPDPKAIGFQGQRSERNAPSLINRAYGKSFFWDGRATTLEEQSVEPISNEIEMGGHIDDVISTLKSHAQYPQAFKTAFAKPNDEAGDARAYVTEENLGKALAGFQRTLLMGNSQVDQFQAGDYAAISDSARQGLWIFESRGKCWQCHAGENFSDESFHNTGVSFGSENRDVGRFKITKDPKDKFAFKTPSLRGVANTAPYMHDGSVKTLEEVVEFYNQGGTREDPGLAKELKPLNLTEQEKKHLVEFLKALSRSE